jgi:hypothetical protein
LSTVNERRLPRARVAGTVQAHAPSQAYACRLVACFPTRELSFLLTRAPRLVCPFQYKAKSTRNVAGLSLASGLNDALKASAAMTVA